MTSDANIKLEVSPAESFLSAPGEVYSSLFSQSSATSSVPATPQSLDGADVSIANDEDTREKSVAANATDDANSGSPAPEKKPAKKRKSWGQVLPEPKTNLPPRKRAKTEDEKEQRRVERVLRNRRAAQSSRERKRLEVEALEQRNKELETLLLNAQKENLMLYQRLTQAEGKSAVLTNTARNTPVTLSQELFSSQDGHAILLGGVKTPALGSFMAASQNLATIDPISLSPSLNPVPDTTGTVADQLPSKTSAELQQQPIPLSLSQPLRKQLCQDQVVMTVSGGASATSEAASGFEPSSDKTHRPAVTLCHDLQCLSVEVSQSQMTSPQLTLAHMAFLCQLMLISLSSVAALAFRHPLTLIALSLKLGFSIPPTRAVLNSIIWLITKPCRRSSAQASTSTISLMRTRRNNKHPDSMFSLAAQAASAQANRPRSTLRLKMLRKILTSNPMLARPLVDATMRVLRLVCSEKLSNVIQAETGTDASATWAAKLSAEDVALLDGDWQWPGGPTTLPSKEALLTLLWALRVNEQRHSIVASSVSPAGLSDNTWTQRNKQVAPKVLANCKRSRDGHSEHCALSRKQRRLN